MLIADDWGYLRLDSRNDAGDRLFQDELGFIRLDARAGMTLCTPGKTVPCGKVCRTPANCKKSNSKERVATIGKENLKEFAQSFREKRAAEIAEKRGRKPATQEQPVKAAATAKAEVKQPRKPRVSSRSAKKPAQESKPIKKYEDFRNEINGAYQKINADFNHDGLVPIHKLRKAMGDRVPREKFDEWMLKMQSDDSFTLSEDKDKNATKEQLDDCVKTKLGVRRCFATSNMEPPAPASKAKPSNSPAKEKEAKQEPISYDTFKSEASKLFDQIDKDGGHDGLVPIYKIRRAIGDKVSRKQFNDMMLQLQNDEEFSYVEGTVEDSAPDKIADCITTKLGKLRCYAKRQGS